MTVDVVVPSSRPELLRRLLAALPERLPGELVVVNAQGRSPAAARNAGWRRAAAEWIAFLDDDVVPSASWVERLLEDLEGLPADVAGSQGRIRVPLPRARRPTDWERNVAGLERARWATADMAYRRSVLEELGGFDERFPRPYREDADLALRARRAGYGLVRGRRMVTHPVGRAGFWVSVAKQAGNADDALMDALHGPRWREEAEAPPGRLRRHVATVAPSLLALAALAGRRRRSARALAAASALGCARLAADRIHPGPATPGEIVRIAVTSLVLPYAAVAQAAAGRVRYAGLARQRRSLGAVLFDRDGTLVEDVPYNGDPDAVLPRPGARDAVRRVRAAGVPVGVVTNQSAIARGLLTEEEVRRVNRRVDELLGPFDVWRICPHAPGDGCGCRKPAPGLVLDAARALGISPGSCAVIGDIGADVEAAQATGARAVLVPTAATRPAEVARAPVVAASVTAAVALLLGDAP